MRAGAEAGRPGAGGVLLLVLMLVLLLVLVVLFWSTGGRRLG